MVQRKHVIYCIVSNDVFIYCARIVMLFQKYISMCRYLKLWRHSFA